MRYSATERELILSQVRNDSSNLTKVFEHVSRQLGRSVNSVKKQYYGPIRSRLTVSLYSTTNDGVSQPNVKVIARRYTSGSITTSIATQQNQTSRINSALHSLSHH